MSSRGSEKRGGGKEEPQMILERNNVRDSANLGCLRAMRLVKSRVLSRMSDNKGSSIEVEGAVRSICERQDLLRPPKPV